MDKLSIYRLDRESYLKHRRDTTRQILLPVILTAVIAVGITALAIVAASGGNSAAVNLWADISIIWLILPMMFFLLLILALLVGLAYGLAKLIHISPHYTGLAQHYSLWLNAKIVMWVDKFVQPTLTLKAWLGLFLKREE